ncbi:hypothetical protein BDV95DRAFT_603568 [Massariosphaeria phaeospora]|uniref:Ubiquitin-like domain-containing protein n=1 Tax=Massariosphaeria phaeospora TaxID=100035 RepID=A0A7C8MER0_9PLEO|nr:hypothetical protein BDV95DRAFT_603568 [Massariosphaeria phaeospora]
MAVPFGFSCGDVIAGTNLLITSINAIKDSTGSSSEYRAVGATLRQIEVALEGLNELDIDNASHRRALEVSASQCGATIFQFISKISKYKSSLESPTTFKNWKSVIRKVEWSLYSKDDVRRFQAQLQGDLLALQTTLQRIHLAITTANVKETRAALIRVETRLDQGNAAQSLVLQALSRCFKEFRGLLIGVYFTNMRIINFLLSGPQISTQVQDERPVYLDDPHGRVIPFLRCWITDWDDFDTILKVQFKRVPGLKKISAREYMLRDGSRTDEITRSTPVDSVFLPGRRIVMSMVFATTTTSTSCPKCFSPVPNCDTEVKCPTCGVFFSRLRTTATVSEENTAVSEPLPPAWRYQAWTSLAKGSALRSVDGSSTRTLVAGMGGPRFTIPFDCVEDFSRVRIVEVARKRIPTSTNRSGEDVKHTSQGDSTPEDPPILEDSVMQRLQQHANNEHIDAECVMNIIEMDDDHGCIDAVRDFSRSMYKELFDLYRGNLPLMEERWDIKDFLQVCLLAERVGENAMTLGLVKVGETYMGLYRFRDFLYDEETLKTMRGLLDKGKGEVDSAIEVISMIFNLYRTSD